MKRRIQLNLMVIGLLIIAAILLSASYALAGPVEISLITSKTSYLPGEPVKMQIDVRNVSANKVISQEGFLGQHFYLLITFIDPNLKPVTTTFKDVGYEGGPPYRFQDQDAAVVEEIPIGATDTTVLEDARTYYNLTTYGHYTAKVYAHLETYSSAAIDQDAGKLIAYLSDQTGSATIVSNEVAFDVLAPAPGVQSTIQADVRLLKIGTGTKPPVEKRPLDGVKDGVSVRLYSRSSAAQYEPINWKTYSLIWNDLHVQPVQTALPDSDGKAVFSPVPKDDYILMASYQGVYAMSHVQATDLNWGLPEPIVRHLMFMQKANGKNAPGKTTKKTGSLLLIIEPEYIEWDSTQELYPFVFETIERWGISTSVTPPEGFSSDYNALNADVENETEAVQFTITDIGSAWKETKVKHKIKHKGKNETIESTIGMKLSPRLAKEKRKSIYGDAEGPGIFEDGKRTDKKIKEVK